MAGWNEFTVVDRREAVVSALRDPLLSSNPGVDSPNLLFLDGADHRRLRALVRRILARLEPLPSSLVEEIRTLVGALASRDGFDLVADFARPVAGVVAAAVLGVGSLDDRVLASLEEAEANLEIWSGVAGAGDRAALRVAMFFLKSDPIPGGGLAVLREARLAGEVSDDELTLTPVMLAHAAYANSLNFLALAGLRIASDPALARRARGAPDTAVTRALAAELIPARYVLRRATAPTEIDGVAVAPGERVAIALGPEPIGLPFGLGRHACPGARIAVEESDTALRALADVLAPGCTLGEIHHKPHPVFHGLHHAFLTPHRTGRL